jgi:hypothetical protein
LLYHILILYVVPSISLSLPPPSLSTGGQLHATRGAASCALHTTTSHDIAHTATTLRPSPSTVLSSHPLPLKWMHINMQKAMNKSGGGGTRGDGATPSLRQCLYGFQGTSPTPRQGGSSPPSTLAHLVERLILPFGMLH